MPEVTFLAFSSVDDRVYTFHFEIFIGECLVTIQTILAYEPAPFRRGCAGRKVNNRAQEKEYSCCHIYKVSAGGSQVRFHYEFRPLSLCIVMLSACRKNVTSKHTWSIGALAILDCRFQTEAS